MTELQAQLLRTEEELDLSDKRYVVTAVTDSLSHILVTCMLVSRWRLKG